MTNVFIGNLASDRISDELHELFQAYGPPTGVEIAPILKVDIPGASPS
jgi:hypothetical protein